MHIYKLALLMGIAATPSCSRDTSEATEDASEAEDTECSDIEEYYLVPGETREGDNGLLRLETASVNAVGHHVGQNELYFNIWGTEGAVTDATISLVSPVFPNSSAAETGPHENPQAEGSYFIRDLYYPSPGDWDLEIRVETPTLSDTFRFRLCVQEAG